MKRIVLMMNRLIPKPQAVLLASPSAIVMREMFLNIRPELVQAWMPPAEVPRPTARSASRGLKPAMPASSKAMGLMNTGVAMAPAPSVATRTVATYRAMGSRAGVLRAL